MVLLLLSLACVWLSLLPSASAHCPNLCNRHGSCLRNNTCLCFSGWTGSDCSLRTF